MNTELVENVEADYRCRTIVSRQVWSDYLQQAVRKLDYPNFKDAMHGVFEDARLSWMSGQQCSQCNHEVEAW
jgi:hypothetical protein